RRASGDARPARGGSPAAPLTEVSYKIEYASKNKTRKLIAYKQGRTTFITASDLSKLIKGRVHRYKQSSSLVMRLPFGRLLEFKPGERTVSFTDTTLRLSKAVIFDHGRYLIPIDILEEDRFCRYVNFNFEFSGDRTLKIFTVATIPVPDISTDEARTIITFDLPRAMKDYELNFFPPKSKDSKPRLTLRFPFSRVDGDLKDIYKNKVLEAKAMQDNTEKSVLFTFNLPSGTSMDDVTAEHKSWPRSRLVVTVADEGKYLESLMAPELEIKQPVKPAKAKPARIILKQQAKRPAPKLMQASMFTIFLDPGHGGIDAGTTGRSGIKEKTVNLVLTQKIAKRLRELMPDANIVLSRQNDKTVDLEKRPAAAQAKNADLFVSIHSNAASTQHKGGFEIYAPITEGAGKLADWALQGSHDLAANIALALDKRVGSRIKNRGIRKNDFLVLREARVPAVLIEAGFLTNKKDERQLLNADFQNEFAIAVADGIGKYARSIRTPGKTLAKRPKVDSRGGSAAR
ncbi:MAG: N-acetylmuramoyl-L-alanine amidase, partial [Elusimicrobiota bacterium]